MSPILNLKILCLIPARGGSKSIPRKNLLNLMGKPLISWSIQQAFQSKYINRVIVSTDDAEIADVSKSFGAEVPFIRPKELAQDSSLDIETFAHALKWLKSNENYQPELIVHLRPTGPARRVEYIDLAIEKIHSDSSADSLRSVSVAHQNPFKMWFISNNHIKPALTLKNVKDAHSSGRQMLPIAYWQNGYIDIVRSETILQKESMVGENVIPFVINDKICDIDYIDDIPKVELAMKQMLEDGDIPYISSDRLPV